MDYQQNIVGIFNVGWINQWYLSKNEACCHSIYFKEFVAFFVYYLPLPKRRTCWMVTIKIYNIAMVGVLCDDTMSEWPKIWQSLAI